MPPLDSLPSLLAAELSRQYDVLRLIGRGGMGSVWLARERSLDRPVAIKVLAGEAIESSSLRERFRREARIAARLVHPHIVPLHAFGETDDALYFVMGYVEGETLADRLEREGRLDRAVALRILDEISDALAFAHREGVVHRDVKPENILLDAKSGRALLADFGVARVGGAGTSVTLTGMAIGTPSYMAPEQAAADPQVDGRSDVYALSVVGYRMLAGRLPFTSASLQTMLSQHAVAKPDDLALMVRPADRTIARVLMRGLEKDPAARWARADDLRDALEASASELAALPDELESIQGLGTTLLVPLTAFSSLLYYLGMATRAPELSLQFGLMGAGALAVVATLRARPAARTFGWRETLHTLFHPPSWWSSWWPKSLRRADDQWDRLPVVVRRFRVWRDVFAAWIGQQVLFNPMPWLERLVHEPNDVPIVIGSNLVFIGLAAGVLVYLNRTNRRLMAEGLTRQDARKFLSLPNSASHPGWKYRQFARLLEPAADVAAAGRTPRSPAELADAVGELNERLRRSGLLPDDESAAAARAVRTAIEALEGEIQRLHEQLDPAELERLDARLSSLGDDADDAEIRRLLESQRELWLRLETRRREKEARRDRMHDQLRTLWMQLLELDARVARGHVVDPALTGEVRALARDLARTGDALSEAERLLAGLAPVDRAGKREVTPV